MLSGFSLLLVLLVVSIGSVLCFGLDLDIDMDCRLESPTIESPLGTDHLGRDLLSSVVAALWFSILFACVTVALTALIGLVIGLLSGYYEGWCELLLLRPGDILFAFPSVLLLLLWISVFGSGIFTFATILVLVNWVSYARLIRGEVLVQKRLDFVQAAIGYNASDLRILTRHILPNILPLFWVQLTLGISNIILIESGIHFIGIGGNDDSPVPTLGSLVFDAQAYMQHEPRLLYVPAIVLFLLVLSINLIGDGLKARFAKVQRENILGD